MDFLRSLLAAITWNGAFEDEPSGGDDPSYGDDEIRYLKEAVRERFEKEHKMNLSSGTAGADGWHKKGGGIPYFQASEPTTRPDGITSLNADDNGRRWIRSTDYAESVYDHPSWVPVTVTNSGDNVMTGENEINVAKLTGLSYGDIGTYVIAASTDWDTDTEYLPGTTYNGTTLVRGDDTAVVGSVNADKGYLTVDPATEVNLGLTGTWELFTRVYRASSDRPTGLFLRIA